MRGHHRHRGNAVFHAAHALVLKCGTVLFCQANIQFAFAELVRAAGGRIDILILFSEAPSPIRRNPRTLSVPTIACRPR
jgi:hypothetical protein